jgi:hypothetical protein
MISSILSSLNPNAMRLVPNSNLGSTKNAMLSQVDYTHVTPTHTQKMSQQYNADPVKVNPHFIQTGPTFLHHTKYYGRFTKASELEQFFDVQNCAQQ